MYAYMCEPTHGSYVCALPCVTGAGGTSAASPRARELTNPAGPPRLAQGWEEAVGGRSPADTLSLSGAASRPGARAVVCADPRRVTLCGDPGPWGRPPAREHRPVPSLTRPLELCFLPGSGHRLQPASHRPEGPRTQPPVQVRASRWLQFCPGGVSCPPAESEWVPVVDFRSGRCGPGSGPRSPEEEVSPQAGGTGLGARWGAGRPPEGGPGPGRGPLQGRCPQRQLGTQ